MSGLGFNKVAGAVLATALGIVGLRELSSVVYAEHPAEKAGYAIEVAEAAPEGAAAEIPPDWGTVLPIADLKAGEEVHKKCLSCHNFDPGGPNQTGPNLYGVVGRPPASHGGFSYSSAMTAFAGAHAAWTYENLATFIKNPGKDVPGTKMTFVGVKKQQDRINLIAFLRTLTASPAAIPAPKPAAGAAPAGAPVAAPEGAPAGSPSGGPTGAAPTTGPAAAPAAMTPSPGSNH